MDRDLSEADYVYVWADGFHLNVRLEERCWVHKTANVLDSMPKSAQQRWRAVNAPHLVALVRAGARFERGRLVERSEGHAA
jgi:transposase-like protein